MITLPKLIGYLLLLVCLMPIASEKIDFPPECPTKAIPNVIEDTKIWADNCFKAITGRYPGPKWKGESSTLWRDIDLDGIPEILEIRGTGQKVKSIYVFKPSKLGFKYLGKLRVSPAFYVAKNKHGNTVIVDLHRLGDKDYVLVEIQYLDDEFQVISNTNLQ